jgi:multicomponent Na+:H+ antiporter subunit C
MQIVLTILCGSLMAAGVYLLLSRDLVRILFGLVMLSNAVNLVIFTAGGLDYTRPPLIKADQFVPETAVANALPQALILTAIVIGFALLTFMFILFYRSYEALGTVDTERMRAADASLEAAADTDQSGKEAR